MCKLNTWEQTSWNLNINTKAFFNGNAYENVIESIASVLSNEYQLVEIACTLAIVSYPTSAVTCTQCYVNRSLCCVGIYSEVSNVEIPTAILLTIFLRINISNYNAHKTTVKSTPTWLQVLVCVNILIMTSTLIHVMAWRRQPYLPSLYPSHCWHSLVIHDDMFYTK